MPESSRYSNDPRVRRLPSGSWEFDGPGDVVYEAHPVRVGDPDGPWLVGPSPAPDAVLGDTDAYKAWEAALPRFGSADEAIASVIGGPQ
jgi:hypothetical protein